MVAGYRAPDLTQEVYEQSAIRVSGGKTRMETPGDWPVEGLLAHVAGQGKNGFRVVDVWESEEAFQRFGEKLIPIEGLPPDLISAPQGCPFQPRCPYAVERCVPDNPSLEPVTRGHSIACWVDVTGGREPHAEPVAQGV